MAGCCLYFPWFGRNHNHKNHQPWALVENMLNFNEYLLKRIGTIIAIQLKFTEGSPNYKKKFLSTVFANSEQSCLDSVKLKTTCVVKRGAIYRQAQFLYNSELGTRQFFSFATTTTRQRNIASGTSQGPEKKSKNS